jgi:hypothetical protein
VALLAGSAAWISRERIVGDVIDDYLAEAGVTATYDIIAIGPRVQVIENFVVGDPARPDLTVRRIELELGLGWAGPQAERLTLEGVRAFGSYRDGRFSLGALDPLVFTDSTEPPTLPAINVVLRDARALLDSDYGRVGLKLEGAGRLDDGFAGTLAATAPGVGVDGCRAEAATLYGKVTTANGAPKLAGQLRLGGVACGGASVARADIGTVLTLTSDFAGAEADFNIKGRSVAFDSLRGDALTGTARLGWSGDRIALKHDLVLGNITIPQARLARFSAEGIWRGALDASRGEWQGTLGGMGLVPGAEFDAGLAAAQRGAAGTLIAPLIAKARSSVARSLSGASLSADAVIRHKAGEAAVIIPEGAVTSVGGTRVLAVSQVSAALGPQGITTLSGNILAGGEGLPSINGRMEQDAGGVWALRLAMAEYRAGANRIAIPRMSLRRARAGGVSFDGLIMASGDLPGGALQDATVPIEGKWSQASGLALGTRCLPLRFAALTFSGLALKGQTITLCPEGRAPILAYRTDLRLGARTGPLALAGTLEGSPTSLAAQSLWLRYPEPFAIEGLAVQIGEVESAVQLSAASLSGSLAGDVGGVFTGGAAQLAAVPLDLGALAGRWSFADGTLRIDDGTFTLTDRPPEGEARFNPLIASGASLRLVDNIITASAALRHPKSAQTLTNVAITHDLGTAAGRALLVVPGITFNTAFQPEDLSYLSKGVIALASGKVTGEGQIDWSADAVTSSGRFDTDGLDFGAAFGPVRGLRGSVLFTDLLNLTTAPDQTVTIAAINPGVEVLAGTVQFELNEGTRLSLKDARFPFMGGELQLRPLVMDFGQPEERRYIFEITGLDAATFVTAMELTNLAATGTFDGTVPIVFDQDGNGRIEGGLLIARPGGGNIAYIGELSYEDLGAMGNYAFSALRSLDYRQMQVGLGGDLAGEIITNFDFDGVRQGAGTSQNFITRRLAKLPIRFKVNVRSENFYELSIVARTFFNPELLGNPVARGLGSVVNGRFVPNPRPDPNAPATQPVQPPESDDQP